MCKINGDPKEKKNIERNENTMYVCDFYQPQRDLWLNRRDKICFLHTYVCSLTTQNTAVVFGSLRVCVYTNEVEKVVRDRAS